MVASGLVLLGSVPAIIYFGVIGAILILILGEMGMAVLLWSLFQRVRNTYKGSNLAAI
jgi:hypothetical protein